MKAGPTPSRVDEGHWDQAGRFVALAGVVGLTLVGIGCSTESKSASDLVARGEYLVTIGSCNDCHTPYKMGQAGPEPDMTRMLSGHPSHVKPGPPPALTDDWNIAISSTFTSYTGPWGTSYSANLTPHETGIGVWTEEMFIRALRTGKHMGTATGRDIQPPMPWPWINHATDDDLRAMFSYLQSIPAIENVVPACDILHPSAGTPAGGEGLVTRVSGSN